MNLFYIVAITTLFSFQIVDGDDFANWEQNMNKYVDTVAKDFSDYINTLEDEMSRISMDAGGKGGGSGGDKKDGKGGDDKKGGKDGKGGDQPCPGGECPECPGGVCPGGECPVCPECPGGECPVCPECPGGECPECPGGECPVCPECPGEECPGCPACPEEGYVEFDIPTNPTPIPDGGIGLPEPGSSPPSGPKPPNVLGCSVMPPPPMLLEGL